MEKVKSNKQKNDKTFIIVCVVIVLALAVFMSLVFLVPYLTAKKHFNQQASVFSEFTQGEILTVQHPMYRKGQFYGSVAVDIEEGAADIAERLIDAVDSPKYKGADNSIVGNWDMSIIYRTQDGVNHTIYLCENEMYVAKDTKQYRFSPNKENAEEYRQLYAELVALLDENAGK